MRCWICRRTGEEVNGDYINLMEEQIPKIMDAGMIYEVLGAHEDDKKYVKFYEIFDSKVPVCFICEYVIGVFASKSIRDDLENPGNEVSNAVTETLKWAISDLIQEWTTRKKD